MFVVMAGGCGCMAGGSNAPEFAGGVPVCVATAPAGASRCCPSRSPSAAAASATECPSAGRTRCRSEWRGRNRRPAMPVPAPDAARRNERRQPRPDRIVNQRVRHARPYQAARLGTRGLSLSFETRLVAAFILDDVLEERRHPPVRWEPAARRTPQVRPFGELNAQAPPASVERRGRALANGQSRYSVYRWRRRRYRAVRAVCRRDSTCSAKRTDGPKVQFTNTANSP